MRHYGKLTAIYKTFDGGEWIDASLSSIYDNVDSIVMVHSDVSWLGERGNNVEAPARSWASTHDRVGKIHHLRVECRRQEEQYEAGLEYIRARGLPAEVIMAIDADEVWEPGHLCRAKRQIAATTDVAYRCSMHTYLRTPFYRVDPPFGHPVSFFRDPSWLTKCARGCRAPARLLDDCWFHHFTYVRRDENDVFRKIQQSCAADGGESIVPGWREEIWNRLPQGSNVHAFQRWKKVWRGIRKVYWSDLPEQVRQCELMRQFWPDGLLMDGERNTIYDLAKGRRQSVDLGTYRGLSAVILSLACDRCHTVDAYEDVPGDAVANVNEPGLYAEFAKDGRTIDRVRDALRHFGNLTCESNTTVNAAAQFADASVDCLFVDADHSYDGTRANWVAWWPKLTVGALLVFHDDNDIHPGVQQAVRELDGNLSVRRVDIGQYAGSLAAFEKVR